MDFLSDITPQRPSGKVGGLLYDGWAFLMFLVYYLVFRFFLRLTVPMLIGLSLILGLTIELPPVPATIGTALLAALLIGYFNEFYSVQELQGKLDKTRNDYYDAIDYENT